MAVARTLSLARLLCLSLVFLSFFAARSAASPWIVTANYEELVTVQSAYTDYDYDYTEPAETYTDILTVVSPSGAAISTATITQTDEYSEDLMTIVEVLYPYNSAATQTTTADDYYATATADENLYTIYVVNLTYTAPTNCASSWAYATAVELDPPYEVQDALVPTSVSTSYSTDNSYPFQPTVITEVYAYLAPSQVPSTSISILSAEYSPYPSCYNPASDATDSGDDSSSSSSSSDSSSSSSPYCGYYFCDSSDQPSWINDSSYYGISPLAIILISVLGWTFVVFVVGLFESYFHFQRLMKGWQSRRGLPITWLLWIFPVTFLVCLAFTRRGFQARSEEDAQELQQKWKETGFWAKKKLWLRHGFAFSYPATLGPAPPRVGRPSKTIPTQPLLQVTPPASDAGGVSRQPTPRTSDGDADVENAAVAAAPAPAPAPVDTEMSGGISQQSLAVPSPRQARSSRVTFAEDEISEAPASPSSPPLPPLPPLPSLSNIPDTTRNPEVDEATEKPKSEKGE
jgi:hypothetical protein